MVFKNQLEATTFERSNRKNKAYLENNHLELSTQLWLKISLKNNIFNINLRFSHKVLSNKVCSNYLAFNFSSSKTGWTRAKSRERQVTEQFSLFTYFEFTYFLIMRLYAFFWQDKNSLCEARF